MACLQGDDRRSGGQKYGVGDEVSLRRRFRSALSFVGEMRRADSAEVSRHSDRFKRPGDRDKCERLSKKEVKVSLSQRASYLGERAHVGEGRVEIKAAAVERSDAGSLERSSDGRDCERVSQEQKVSFSLALILSRVKSP